MRITCISPSTIPAMTAHSIQMMKASHALAQLGHVVQVLTPEGKPQEWADLARQYGLSVPFTMQHIESPGYWRRYDFMVIALWRARRWKSDLVYTWIPQVASWALGMGLPAVLEMHDMPGGSFAPGAFKRFVERSGRKRLMVITRALQIKLAKTYPGLQDARYVRVAPNGVDVVTYRALPSPAEARQKLNLPSGITAGYTGHFYDGRGGEMLFNLAQNNPQVNFLWAGGTKPDVEKWRARLITEKVFNVSLTGFVNQQQLPMYQAACDILMMPYGKVIRGSSGGNSADICSPMKMFDYLAAGRAILSSDLPVLHEVLDHRNAVFCEPENLHAWQQGLNLLVKDTTLRERLGRQAREDSANYTWTHRAEKALAGL